MTESEETPRSTGEIWSLKMGEREEGKETEEEDEERGRGKTKKGSWACGGRPFFSLQQD